MKLLILFLFFLLINCSSTIISSKCFNSPADAIWYAQHQILKCDSVQVDTLLDDNYKVKCIK